MNSIGNVVEVNSTTASDRFGTVCAKAAKEKTSRTARTFARDMSVEAPIRSASICLEVNHFHPLLKSDKFLTFSVSRLSMEVKLRNDENGAIRTCHRHGHES